MTDTVKVDVVREHSGDAGRHAEGSNYQTTLQHARELRAQGLVEFADPNGKADEAKDADKSEPAPANKAEPRARNKGASK